MYTKSQDRKIGRSGDREIGRSGERNNQSRVYISRNPPSAPFTMCTRVRKLPEFNTVAVP